MYKRLTVAEKERLAELVAAGRPISEICEVIGRDRFTTRRNINYLARRPPPETEAIAAAIEPGRARGDLERNRSR